MSTLRLSQQIWLGLLIATGAFLRFYHLDSQLWLDEVSALVGSYRNSFWDTLTKFPGHFPHPLYEQLAQISLRLLGESPFAIRLPAAVFGIASVAAFYRLARRIGSEGEALLATGLLVVSYHHIYFSQNARGYTLYLFLALVATELLLRLLERMRWQTALAYWVVASLAAYSQTAGLTLAPGQILVALLFLRRMPTRPHKPTIRYLLGTLAATLGLTFLLYSPLIIDMLAHTSGTEPGEVPGAQNARVLDLINETFQGLLAAFAHPVIAIVAIVICALGTWDMARRKLLPLSLLLAPIIISAGAVALLGTPLHPRYFLLGLVVFILVSARGLTVLAHSVTRVIPLPAQILPVCGLAAVAIAAIPLIKYYSIPKQDFLGALRFVRSAAGPADRVAAADLAAHVYQKYYASDLPVVENLADLVREEGSGERVWIITTLEMIEARRRPDLLARLRQNYQLVREFPASTSGGEMRVYSRPAQASGETP